MLWTVCHLWPSRACFLNCYRRHSLLVLHNGDGTTNIIHIREGVKHEVPLDMAAFGIGVL